MYRCLGGGIGRHAGLKILFTENVSAGSIPAWGTDISPDGGMVDTAALGAVVARHVGSSPTWGTLDFLNFLDYLLEHEQRNKAYSD